MGFINQRRVFSLLVIYSVFTFAACESGSLRGKESEVNMAGDKNAAPVVYAALGDSTGAGVGASDGRGYVARLFVRIEHERPRSRLINLCVSHHEAGLRHHP